MLKNTQLGASDTKLTLEMQSFMKSYDEKVLSFSSNLGYHVRCHFRKFNLKLSLFVEKGKRNHRMDQLK